MIAKLKEPETASVNGEIEESDVTDSTVEELNRVRNELKKKMALELTE